MIGLVLVACVLFQTGSVRTASANDDADGKKMIMVSLGDSYASGEGIPPFYGWNDVQAWSFLKPEAWLAHRSIHSWSGMLKLPGVGVMSEHPENWYFVASSGATTEHLKKAQPKKVNNTALDHLAFGTNPAFQVLHNYELPPQLDVFNLLDSRGLQADYVTISIGGNDMKFADVMEQAALLGRYSGFYLLKKKCESIWRTYETKTKYDIKQAYKDIAKCAGKDAQILVAGYPGLVCPKGDDIYFNSAEAIYIDQQVEKFNAELQGIVKSCQQEGMNIHFVDIMTPFYGHEAYSEKPYLRGIEIPAKEDDLDSTAVVSHYSLHPNLQGAEKYRDCFQATIDWLESKKENKSVSTYTWEQLYREYITSREYAQSIQYDISAEGPWFALHDMDNDGTPELIFNGGGEWHEYESHVCTVRDNKVVYLGRMRGPLGMPDEEGHQFGYQYYDSGSYPGLFIESQIFGYYQNESQYYCGYFGIQSNRVYEEVVEATAPDKVLKRTDKEDLYATVKNGTPKLLRFFTLESVQNKKWNEFCTYWNKSETKQAAASWDNTDLWSTFDHSGILNSLSMSYDEIAAGKGQLKSVEVEYEVWFLHYFYMFANSPEISYSFESDLYDAEVTSDFYGSIPGDLALKYIRGSDLCNGICLAPLSAIGFAGKINARDIGAEVLKDENYEDLWIAIAERGGYEYEFICDDSSGTISDRTPCAVRKIPPEGGWLTGN